MNKTQFIALIQQELGIEDEGYAKLATEAVLRTLHDRLTEGESRHIQAHLPQELKSLWSQSLMERLVAMAKGPEKMNKREFLARVQNRSHVGDIKKSEHLTLGVFKALKAQLPDSDAAHVAGQLPRDLKNLWKIA